MAWTGTVNRATKDPGGRGVFNITITSAAGTFTRDFVADFMIGAGAPADFVAWLKAQVMGWAAQIDAVYAFVDAVPQGTQVDFTPPVVTPPDPAFVAFQAQVTLLRRLGLAVQAGVIPASQTQYVNAQAAVLTGLTNNPSWVSALDGLGR